jgi:hypothetical protein
MSSNTGQLRRPGQGRPADFARDEHPDMGNITPRILRCINLLNTEMGAQGPFRRVHHNAESHRNAAFGALTANEMEAGDGLPLTVFQPAGLWQNNAGLRPYQDVSTLLTMQEFQHLRRPAERGRLLRAAQLDLGHVDPRRHAGLNRATTTPPRSGKARGWQNRHARP